MDGSRFLGPTVIAAMSVLCRLVTSTWLLLALAANLADAQPSVSASVDKTTVALDESLSLTITVRGSGHATEPDLSGLDDFAVLSRLQSHSMTMSGGSTSVETAFQYILQPTTEGTATIPSLEVRVGGQTLRTNPITVNVTAPSGSGRTMPPGMSAPVFPPVPPTETVPEKDVFVRLETDKQRAYVGEQILLTFSIFYATRLRSLEYQPAGTKGFRTHPLPSPPDQWETIGGRRYAVKRELKLLYPTAPGKHTITPASVQFTTSFWEPSPTTLSTNAIEIVVSRLPEASQPENFSGVVGELNVEARVDQSRIKIGEAATLTVEVTGWGNLDTMKAPQIKLPSGLRQYQSSEQRKFTPVPYHNGYRMEGKLLFEYVIVPTTVGSINVPPVSVAYFDPHDARYQTARSSSISLHVEVGDSATFAPNMAPTPGTQLRPPPDRLVAYSRDRLVSAPVVLSQLVALVWLGATFAIHWRRAVLAANPSLARMATAAHHATARLKATRGAEPTEAAAHIVSALAGYISDKLNVPPATVSAGSVAGLLGRHGVAEALASEVATVLRECDGVRFGFAESVDVPALCQRALNLIRKLERSLRRYRPSAIGGPV
ncbi:MAG: BatD family protein [Candidatus Zipacnadales bacterium]